MLSNVTKKCDENLMFMKQWKNLFLVAYGVNV